MIHRAEEASQQMQLVEREEIDEDDDLFEAIDKCKISNRFYAFRIFGFLLLSSKFLMTFLQISFQNLHHLFGNRISVFHLF